MGERALGHGQRPVQGHSTRLQIAGVTRIAHAFGCLLAASRKLWVHFYRDERQSTLLEALASGFEYFQGCALRVVLDNEGLVYG